MSLLTGTLAVTIDNSPNEDALALLASRVAALEAPDDTPAHTLADVADSANRFALTTNERAKLANVPANTEAALANIELGLTSKVGQGTFDALGAAVANKADADSVSVLDNALADLAVVVAGKADTAHTHTPAPAPAPEVTQAILAVTSTAAVNLPDADVIYIEHTVNAAVRIPATWSKRPHSLVFLGATAGLTVQLQGANNSGQTIKGTGQTYTSGTDQAAVTRTVCPDPDAVAFPNRWRVF